MGTVITIQPFAGFKKSISTDTVFVAADII